MNTGLLKYIDDTIKEAEMDGYDTLNYLLDNQLNAHADANYSGRVITPISLAEILVVLRFPRRYWKIWAFGAKEDNLKNLKNQAIKTLKQQKIFELLEEFSHAHIPNYNL